MKTEKILIKLYQSILEQHFHRVSDKICGRITVISQHPFATLLLKSYTYKVWTLKWLLAFTKIKKLRKRNVWKRGKRTNYYTKLTIHTISVLRRQFFERFLVRGTSELHKTNTLNNNLPTYNLSFAHVKKQ